VGLINEFKEFAMRGNVVDMAVGVVIGGAFGKIVTSLVNDIVMPVVGKITGGVDFSDLRVTIQAADPESNLEAVSINYGAFINTAIDFVIVAAAIFVVIKMMNKLKRKQEAVPPPTASPPEDIVLLREIRDSLASKR